MKLEKKDLEAITVNVEFDDSSIKIWLQYCDPDTGKYIHSNPFYATFPDAIRNDHTMNEARVKEYTRLCLKEENRDVRKIVKEEMHAVFEEIVKGKAA